MGKAKSQRRLVSRRSLLAWVLTLSAAGQVAAQSRPEVVLVVIGTNGIYLSHSRVKPGKVRFLVKNQTTVEPDLELVAEGQQQGKTGIKLTPDVRARRSWQEATVVPGSYQLHLAAVPTNFTRITVAP